jgi:hypothetical protein
VYNNSAVTGVPISDEVAAKIPGVQWIWYFQAFWTWIVVVAVQRTIYRYQKEVFLPLRERWLDRDPEPHCSSLLVEGIPDEYCTDETFKDYMSTIFDVKDEYGRLKQAVVKDAFVIKDFSFRARNPSAYELHNTLNQWKALDQSIHEQEYALENEKKDLKAGTSVADAEAKLQSDRAKLEDLVKEIIGLQKQVKADAAYRAVRPNGEPDTSEQGANQYHLYTSNGIVTFTDRRWQNMCQDLMVSESFDEWQFEEAPTQHDINYDALMVGDKRKGVFLFIGYCLLAALFFVYMPVVLWLNDACDALVAIPWITNIIEATGMMDTVDGVLATAGLTIMTSFLPSFIMWIFAGFFALSSDGAAQFKLQKWYFWFQIVFVLLISAIGTNLTAFFQTLAEDPFGIFSLLADSLPATTHFFLNFVIMQPFTHAMNLTRYMPLIKYMVFKAVCSEERARELSEPEDQDYYGMGSRSARFSLMLVIGLTFGTICPLMNVVVFFNFFACRVIYGYLIPYAETKKNDLGGVHWAFQLHHIMLGSLIYNILMVGMLLQRAESHAPGFIAGTSFLFWFISFRNFNIQLQWERIPFNRVSPPGVINKDDKGKSLTKRKTPEEERSGRPLEKYYQRELAENSEDWFAY